MGFRSVCKASKGVAIHAVVLVVIFAFMLIFIFAVFGGYVHIQNCTIANIACSKRQEAQCFMWWKNDQTFQSGEPDWSEVDSCNESGNVVPRGCPKPTADACRTMLKQT